MVVDGSTLVEVVIHPWRYGLYGVNHARKWRVVVLWCLTCLLNWIEVDIVMTKRNIIGKVGCLGLLSHSIECLSEANIFLGQLLDLLLLLHRLISECF